MAWGASVHRDQPARHPVDLVHLNDEHPFAVWGKVGSVRHSQLMCRDVNVTAFRPAYAGGQERHVQSGFDFGEKNPLGIYPCQGCGIGEPELWLPAQQWYCPCVPRIVLTQHGVGDP